MPLIARGPLCQALPCQALLCRVPPGPALALAVLLAAGPAGAAETGPAAPPALPAGALLGAARVPDLIGAAPAARPAGEPIAARRPEACPTHGAGFVRLPGRGTCVRLSGRTAAGLDVAAGRHGAAATPTVAGRFALDTRTETDLGPVRAYVRIGNGRR